MYLPQILSSLRKHLKYLWMCVVKHAGNGNLTLLGQPPIKVINKCKPILVFTTASGDAPQVKFCDLIEGSGSQKDGHNWQQPVEEAKQILSIFAREEDFIVDPFAGSGSFGEAAKQLGLNFLGAEVIDIGSATENA
jgi:DNA modification methylase